MMGDEYFKYALSEDGYTLLSDGYTWNYATIDENGNLISSKFSLVTIEDESNELKEFKSKCPKHILPTKMERINNDSRRTQRIGIHNGDPITGQRHALVVLMQYKDVKLTKTLDDFDALFNETGYSLDNAKGSVKDFYSFASAGQLEYVSDVYGPYTAANNMRYYGQNSSRGGGDLNAIDLCIEAIRNLPKDIDYSKYDNDDDGIVDNIHIIFAGYGEEAGASSDAIWSHEYPYKIVMKSEVGYNFAGYSCTPELRGNSGEKISNIGVICHELGHALGANDYYDTNYAVEGNYEGTGKWDIMASGSWNDDGRLPPNFNPYIRTHDFGWEKQIELTEDGPITLLPHSYNIDDNVVYKITTNSDNDYFLLENRQQINFDASLPGSGLMIYHVHPNIEHLSSTNSINDTNPQGLYPVCASGSKPNSKQYGNINTGECPFPGTRHVTSFSPSTNPAAKAWDGSNARLSLYGISQLDDGSVCFNVTQNENVTDDPIIDDDDDKLKTIFSDSFEQGLNGYVCSVLMGKKEWDFYPSSQIVPNTEMIPSPSDGNKLLMLYTGKEKTICEAEIVRKNNSITPDQKHFLSFDVKTSMLSGSLNPVFKFWIKDENMQIYSQILTDVKEEWEHIEVPFTSTLNSIEFGFYGSISTGGLFVDNVKIQTIDETSGVLQPSVSDAFTISIVGQNVNISANTPVNLQFYTVSGLLKEHIYLGHQESKQIQLPVGGYIVKASNGNIQKLFIGVGKEIPQKISTLSDR